MSWQDWDDETECGELIEDAGQIHGADAAIEWARARTDRVLIRLAHTEESYFSAGRERETVHEDGRQLPEWPPSQPDEGWWIPRRTDS